MIYVYFFVLFCFFPPLFIKSIKRENVWIFLLFHIRDEVNVVPEIFCLTII